MPSQWHRQSEQIALEGTLRRNQREVDSSGRGVTETQLWMTSVHKEKSHYDNIERNHTLGGILELQNKCTCGLCTFSFKHS